MPQESQEVHRCPATIAKQWPANFFIVGKGGNCYFVDAGQKNPDVQYIASNRKLNEKNHLTPGFYASISAFAKQAETMAKLVVKGKRQADTLARERTRAKTSPRKSTDVACPDLVAEGQRLAKPAILLRPKGTEVIAIAGGNGVGEPPRKAMEHILTVACSALPDNPNGLTGVIGVYRVDEDAMVKAVYFPDAQLSRATGGTKLHGARHDCLPPFGVLVQKGSAAVKKWFQSQKVAGRDAESWAESRTQGDFPELDRYLAAFRASHPFFTVKSKTNNFMLGGWTLEYPSGSEWFAIMNKPLLISKLGGEPWLEVVGQGKSLKTYCHVS